MNVAYLYTTAKDLEVIIANGQISPSAICSTNATWDHLGGALWEDNDGKRVLSMEETHAWEGGGGLARILLHPESVRTRWSSFRLHLPPRSKDILERTIAAGSDPLDWRIGREAVPRDKWLGIEFWIDGVWQPKSI